MENNDLHQATARAASGLTPDGTDALAGGYEGGTYEEEELWPNHRYI